jgi:O-antigen/teichoic acid export membrane protein
MRWSDMKRVIKWASVIGIISALELAFGINETGGRIALVLLCWSVLSIPLVLLGKKILDAVDRDLMNY